MANVLTSKNATTSSVSFNILTTRWPNLPSRKQLPHQLQHTLRALVLSYSFYCFPLRLRAPKISKWGQARCEFECFLGTAISLALTFSPFEKCLSEQNQLVFSRSGAEIKIRTDSSVLARRWWLSRCREGRILRETSAPPAPAPRLRQMLFPPLPHNPHIHNTCVTHSGFAPTASKYHTHSLIHWRTHSPQIFPIFLSSHFSFFS